MVVAAFRRNRGRSRAAGAGALVSGAARTLQQYWRGSKRSRRSVSSKTEDDSTNVRAGPSKLTPALTFQHDRVVTYRRRRPNMRRIRRIRKFGNRVMNAVERGIGLKTLLRSPVFGNNSVIAGQQGFVDIILGSAAVGTGGEPDLVACRDYFSRSATAPGYESPIRVLVNSMVSTVRLSNTSASSAGVYLTLYFYSVKLSLPYADGSGAGIYLNNSLLNVPIFGNTGTPVVQYQGFQDGVTPFLSRQWCQHFTVNRIESAFLGVGSEMTFNMIDRRPKVIASELINDFSCIKGITQGCLVVYRGQINSLGGSEAVSISYNYINTYTGHHIASATTQGGLL